MDKTYSPADIEKRWYATWEERGYFQPAEEGDKSYCIMIPPPNVTGSLHMGHAFQDTLMDALTRYHRMQGEKTLWQIGTDHAGIATQMVVERLINAEGKTRYDYGREPFIERIWKWKNESGDTITRQLRRMGASLDWSSERFTMEEGLSAAVKEVFVRLYEEGLIYRGKRLVNWDPVLLTAVSDLEVLSEEENGHLWHMRYPLSNGKGHMIVATTRPETMLGDFAVAIHPDDERYRHLLGEFVDLPLTDRRIPIIADEHVDAEFGTGCVKITPAHDFNDYEVWQRHRDKSSVQEQPHGGLINIFTAEARIRDNAADEGQLIPAAYIGMDRMQARKQIIADLDARGLMEKIEDHKLMVPRGDRSNSIIEPFLTDQWYVHTASLAEPAIKAVEEGDIRFVPDNWKNTYFEWMNNIEDWCISRQIWWGHRIPAWYDGKGSVYVGRSEAEIREKHDLSDDYRLVQDEDVLDTWFSSALWPFSTLGWPEKTPRLQDFYPTNVLVTGFDIIFFWVARMIMMGLKFMGDVPFREVYIHGLVRDAEGQKMSKSKGNVLDPLDMIDGIDLEGLVKKRTSGMMQEHLAERSEAMTRKAFPQGIPCFGVDALRFTFAAMASTGRDIKLTLERITGYRNFCNKLWNASRFVLMNTEQQDCAQQGGELALSAADHWIISRLAAATGEIQKAAETYRFDQIAQTIYEFIWNEYCDWYVELSKTTLNNAEASEAELRATRHTLVTVLEAALRMAHPIIPFITEEIWQTVAPLAGKQAETIMLQPYPHTDDFRYDKAAVADIEWLQGFISGIRQIRGEMNIDPKKRLPVLLQNGTQQDRERVQQQARWLASVGRVSNINWLQAEEPVPESMTALSGDLKILIPMSGLIDVQAEVARLQKKLDNLHKDKDKTTAKLANANFVERAPHAVVAQERARLEEMSSAIAQLQDQLEKIKKM